MPKNMRFFLKHLMAKPLLQYRNVIRITLFSFLSLCIAQYTYTQTLDSFFRQLQNAKEDTGKVNLLRNIGASYLNEDPRKAILYFQQGIALSYKLNYTKGLARNYINIGTAYSYLSNMDSTIIYADSGIKYSLIIGDPERLALVYLNKGDGYRNIGNFEQAMLYCDTAAGYAAKTTNTDRQARIYSIISSIYIAQQQYTHALAEGRKALDLFRKDSNQVMVATTYDDFGMIYLQMKQLDSALHYTRLAVEIGEETKDYNDLSTYYLGLAQVYLEKGENANAKKYVLKSIQMGKDQQNNSQLISSHKLLAGIYLKEGNLAASLQAATMASSYITSEAELAAQQDVAALLAEIYAAMGDEKNAYKYLSLSSRLKDSVMQGQYAETVAKLQSSFQLKERDKEILLLAKDKELQQQKLTRQKGFIIASSAVALLALGGIWLLMNQNKLKQRMKELELRNQIAADLHDEVGSSLSSIHLLSQMAAQPANVTIQKNILDRMSVNAKETMEKMSDLVWAIKPEESEGTNLRQRMEIFAYEICGTKNIVLDLQLDKLNTKDLNMEQRKNMYLIFKEALNNAVKYSGTEKIHVSAVNGGNLLTMIVRDEGRGFDDKIVSRGNGLDNIRERALSIGGQLGITSVPGKGTEVMLQIPLK